MGTREMVTWYHGCRVIWLRVPPQPNSIVAFGDHPSYQTDVSCSNPCFAVIVAHVPTSLSTTSGITSHISPTEQR